MIYPKIYNNFPYILNKKTSKAIIAWLILLVIGSLVFIIIAFNYRYHLYDSYLGYVKNLDGSFYTVTYIEKEKVGLLSQYNLSVEGQSLSFEVVKISDEFYIDNDNIFYQVVLDFDLKESQLIENNIINIVFEKPETTIYEEIRKGLKL